MVVKTYPNLEGWEEYARAVQAYGELLEEERSLGAKLGELPNLQRQAEAADDQAQAAAMRAGEKDPGRKASEKAKADAEKARTWLRAVREAIEQQTQHLD